MAPVHSKAPVAGRELRRLVLATPADSRAGLRDRPPLLIGQLGAFRRSELVALDVQDVEQLEDGLRIRIQRSKTDQEGAGEWELATSDHVSRRSYVRAFGTWWRARRTAARLKL